jgi:hypothetical protein
LTIKMPNSATPRSTSKKAIRSLASVTTMNHALFAETRT